MSDRREETIVHICHALEKQSRGQGFEEAYDSAYSILRDVLKLCTEEQIQKVDDLTEVEYLLNDWG